MMQDYPWSYLEPEQRSKKPSPSHEYQDLYDAPPAQQLQQAVARALDEAADFICSGPPPAKVEGGHIEIGKRARRAYAAAIRAKGTQ